MSFSGEVQKEIIDTLPRQRHCREAFLAGLFSVCGRTSGPAGRGIFTLRTENPDVARICFTLLRKTCRICPDVRVRLARTFVFTLKITGKTAEEASRFLLKGPEIPAPERRNREKPDRACCRRSYIRGVFLAAGSVNRPSGSYHMEFVCSDREKADYLVQLMESFGVKGRVAVRKKHFVVYLKEGDDISTMLNVMGAPRSLMNMENMRILKEVRGTVNRRVNCEASNIRKTAVASVRQINDIIYIRDTEGFHILSEPLREMAEARLAWPDVTLLELGGHMDPPVGKSGVNHRLRRLGEIAEDIRRRRYDNQDSTGSHAGGSGHPSHSSAGSDGQPV